MPSDSAVVWYLEMLADNDVEARVCTATRWRLDKCRHLSCWIGLEIKSVTCATVPSQRSRTTGVYYDLWYCYIHCWFLSKRCWLFNNGNKNNIPCKMEISCSTFFLKYVNEPQQQNSFLRMIFQMYVVYIHALGSTKVFRVLPYHILDGETGYVIGFCFKTDTLSLNE